MIVYKWKKETVNDEEELVPTLNQLEQDGWEIFNVLPTIKFETKRTFGVSVQLPSMVSHIVVARKKLESLNRSSVDG